MSEPRTKRKQQAWETRRKIADCALRLFEEKGFNNVSMLMIAEESQTSIGAIYHYFSGKDEIAARALVVLDEQYNNFFEELFSKKAYKNLSPLEKLKEYFIFVQMRSSELNSLNYAYIHDLKNMEAKILGVNKERLIYKNYMFLLDLCRQKGLITEDLSDEDVIEMLTQVSRGLLVNWMINNKESDIYKQAQKLINAVIEGIKR